jgi:hypothetical protein
LFRQADAAEAEASGGFSLAQLVNFSIAREEAQKQIDAGPLNE